MRMSNVFFSKEAREDILGVYGKKIGEEGFIVEIENPEQRVLTPKGEEIHIEEWGGIIKGSLEFIKSDTFSLVELAKKIE